MVVARRRVLHSPGFDIRQGREYLTPPRDQRVVYLSGRLVAVDVRGSVGPAISAPVRAETRAGIGMCQARDCGRRIEALVGQAVEVPLERVPPLSVRPPVVPILHGAIAERPLELV